MGDLRPRTSHAVRIVSREASASRLPDAKGCATRLTGCYGSLWETGACRGEKWGKGEDGHQLLHVVSHVDATSTPLGQNGPKRAGGLRTRSHGAGRASDFAWGVTPCRRARTASEVRGVSGVSLLGVLRRPAEPHQRRTRNALPGLWRQTRQRRLQSGVRRSAPLVTLRGRVVGGVQAMVIRRGPVARSGRDSPRSGRPRAPGRKSASRRSGPGCLP